jgi:hypothetical protein
MDRDDHHTFAKGRRWVSRAAAQQALIETCPGSKASALLPTPRCQRKMR